MADGMDGSFEVSERNRVKRLGQRGSYDKETVYGVLDAALLCHIAYVIDGQPFCTPTAFWREGDHLYWHGSAASRMVRSQAKGIPVCLAVTHMDGLVLARCGFNHSVDYRSAMVFGTAAVVNDPAQKARAADAFLDRFYPGRAALMRPATTQEMKATTFLAMEIEQASAKVRAAGVKDDEEDYAVPVWAGELRLKTVVEEIRPCPRLLPGVELDPAMADWTPGARLDEVLETTYRRLYGQG